jgi:hypothetical protein
MTPNARIVLIGLVVLVVGGAYNYHRNQDLDEDLAFRPYRGVASADLAVLAQAYEEELEGLHRRYETFGEPLDAEDPSSDPGVVVRLSDFERSQRVNERRKGLHRKILDREIELETLQTEQRIRRQGLDREWKRILRRATTL